MCRGEPCEPEEANCSSIHNVAVTFLAGTGMLLVAYKAAELAAGLAAFLFLSCSPLAYILYECHRDSRKGLSRFYTVPGFLVALCTTVAAGLLSLCVPHHQDMTPTATFWSLSCWLTTVVFPRWGQTGLPAQQPLCQIVWQPPSAFGMPDRPS